MENNLDSFRLWLHRNGRARSTISARTETIERLLRDVNPLTQDGVERYLLDMYDKGRSAKYLNTVLDALRLYQKHLNVPQWTIPYFKEKETFKVLLSNDEINDILNLKPPRNGEKEKQNWNRWTIFFKICALSGMRPGEVAKLTASDLDLGQNIISIRETKTNEFRVIPISPKLINDLLIYTKTLNGQFLFPSKRSAGVVDDVDWGYNFQTRLKRLGINRKGVSVYSLRFSFITRLLSEDVNLFKVQRIVGHHRVEQTAHYTRYVVKDLQKAIERDSLAKDGVNPEKIIGWVVKFVEGIVTHDDRFEYKVNLGRDSLNLQLSIK